MRLSDKLAAAAAPGREDERDAGTVAAPAAPVAPTSAPRTVRRTVRRSAPAARAVPAGGTRTPDRGAAEPGAPDAGPAAAAAPAAPPRTPAHASDRAGGPAARRTEQWQETKRAVRGMVLAELSPRLTGADALDDDELADEVGRVVDRLLQREDVQVSPVERRRFVAELRADLLGHGPLEPLLADPTVTEVMCNRWDEVWVEREGRVEPTQVTFADDAQYRQVIERIVSGVGRRVDESSPMVDARLPDGSRVNVILPPLALRGPVLTIRRFAADPLTVTDLVSYGSLPQDLAVFLEAAVRAECNVLISGGTASGKTTLLNVLSSFVPTGERIITIEDAAELQLQQPHVVQLESRPASAEGTGQVAIRDLVRNALRMRPDRIVVGEVRGGEALDMLQAMNTGHDGSLTTVHANAPRDALSRLETLVLMAEVDLPQRAIREQVAAAIDLIVQVERLPDGQRKVTSVQEVQGMEGDTILLQEVFRYQGRVVDGRYVGTARATGLRPRLVERFAERGVDVPLHVFRPSPEQDAPAAAGGAR